MKKLFLLLVAVLMIGACAFAQNRTIRGTVLDAANEEPLIGVSVTAGAGVGASTDIEGHFIITVPQDAKRLTVSYVGYETQQVNITSGNIVVKMHESSTVLNEVIAVAYGTTKRSEYTGSAGVVKADQLEDAIVADVTNALSGKVAGVQVQSSNGQPGTTATVRIRGVGSINASSSPLYVVDGMPYDGDIAAIATTDIESMTILKDAASTALYGARGANGVILITTKRGQEGQAKITFDARWGSNSRAIPNYDVITDQRQYLETVYTALYNTRVYGYGATPEAANSYANKNIWSSLGYQTWTTPAGESLIGLNGKVNPNATPGYLSGNYYYIADDWTNETLTNGLRQEYTMSVTGGTQRLNYYLSGSYLSDEGIISNSHFKRFSTRAVVDYQAKDWLKIGTNVNYTYQNSGYPDDQTSSSSSSSANAFNLVNNIAPIYPMYIRDANGNILYNSTYNQKVYDYGDGADYGLGRTGYTRNVYSSSNPASDLIYNHDDILSDVIDAKWYAILTPIKGLNVSGTASYHADNTREHYLANNLYGQTANYGGQVIQYAGRARSLQFQALASYNHTFAEDHEFDIMAGYESQDYQSEYVEAIGSNLYQPGVAFVNNTIDDIRGYGAQSNLVHRGFIARLKYNYAGKYYFMGSFRRDASSRFAPEHRWGSFWSVSGGWDINKEAFMQDFSNLDLLKFKVSFGQNGNDGIGTNGIAYADQYTIGGADGVWYDGVLYYKGNRDITWETSNAFNIGFDFSFWKGKFYGSAEYFNRQTSDMLFNIPTSGTLGYTSVPMNVGSMRNNGVEIDLNYQPIKTRDFNLAVNANITFAGNKVLKLAPELLTDGQWEASSTRIMREGESMYQLYLVKYAGVDPANGTALYWAYGDLTDDNGDKIVIGQNADGSDIYQQGEYTTDNWQTAYNSNRQSTGNIMPKAYGGFGVTADAYGFDLSVSFAYQFGGRIYDSSYQSYMDAGSTSFLGQTWHKDILNAWTAENTNTDVPKLGTTSTDGTSGTLYNNTSYTNSTSDRFLISSNYLSLNNITVGYTLPAKITNKLYLSNLRVYFAAENVALWSKRKGLDPRQSFVSSSNTTYSPIRSLIGGIRVSF
jgi:TonB-linked SusC/RagA family outer membrane protein